MAPIPAPVLIEGETGTGKELAARALHYQGPRRGKAFVPVNCGALPETLFENELFGHARGAFTDARTDQAGLIQLAEGGTLFLDEIDALPLKAQVSLLRFLQDQRYRPLGARREQVADVRVVAASNQPLTERVEVGAFRPDLLYRLRLLHLRLPSLRERPGDAALLAAHFADMASRKFGGQPRPLSARSRDWFDRYDWPGNVRELEYLVYQAYLVGNGDEIDVPPPESLAGEAGDPALEAGSYQCAKAHAIAEFEQRFLTRVMRSTGGNVSEAARQIGTERRYLGRLLKKHGIERIERD